MKKHIHVAVGVVLNQYQEVLIAKRHAEQHQGGLWEFPGGKVEKNESCLAALQREFLEEVAIEIDHAEPLIIIEHDYGDKAVKLETLISDQYRGEAKGVEGQSVKWVSVSELENYAFPAANKAIITAIKKQFN